MYDSTHLAKVHFVKDDLVRMSDAPEAGYEGEDGDEGDGNLVVPLRALLLRLIRLCLLQDIGHLLRHLLGEGLGVGRGRTLLAVLGRALPHLAAGGRHGVLDLEAPW
jgi:hypothetical protein